MRWLVGLGWLTIDGRYVIEVKKLQYVPVSRQVYVDAVESDERGVVEAALLANLAALVGLGVLANDPPAGWHLRLPQTRFRETYSGVKPR
jgi:hypothetical protein